MSDTAPKTPTPTPTPIPQSSQTTSETPQTVPSLIQAAWRQGDILQMQRLVGNRQLQRILDHPQRLNRLANPVIQRDFAVQIDLDISDTISEIVLSGTRPKGALAQAKEGSHTTAWVVTVDGVRNAVEGKSIEDAVTAMDDLFTVAQDLPGTERVDELLAYKQDEYNDALSKANTAQTNAQSKKDINTLQTYIRAYLTYRNIIPLSAVDSGGNADGRSEAFVAALVRDYSSYDKSIIKRAMLALFDAPAIRQASDDNQGTSQGTRSANTPGMTSTESAADFRVETMKQHLLSLEASYPDAYTYAFGNIDKDNATTLRNLFTQALGAKAKEILSDANQSVDDDMEDDAPEPKNEDDETEESYGSGKHNASVQVVLTNDDKVSNVIFGSRPHGLFGSKHGSHTTAWGIFTEGVLNATKNKTIANAAAGIKALSQTALALPGVARANYLTDVRKKAFLESKSELEGYDADTITTINALQNYIREYLTFRNLVPLSTAMLGRAPGKGESEALGKLRAPASHTKEILQAAIFKLMDSDALLAIGKGSQKLPEKIKGDNLNALDIEQNLKDYIVKKGMVTRQELRVRAKANSTNPTVDKVKKAIADARVEITTSVEELDKLIASENDPVQKQSAIDRRNGLIKKYLKDWYSPESDESTHQRLPGTEGWSQTTTKKFGSTTAEASTKGAQRLTEVLKQHMMTIKASFPTAYTKAAMDTATIKAALITLRPGIVLMDDQSILASLIDEVTGKDAMLQQCLAP